MTDQRKNFLILGLVLVLVVGAVAAVATKGFVQGLDLRGGLQLIVKAEPPKGQTVTPQQLTNAASVMRRRIDPNGVKQPEIRTSSSDNTIEVSLPGVKDPAAVGDLITAGGFQNFDFYKFLAPISAPAQKYGNPVTQKSLYDLLTKGAKGDKNGAALAEEWGLFNSTTKKLFGRTQLEPTQAQVLHLTKSGRKPPNTEWKYVPKGQMAISCRTTTLNVCPGTSPASRDQVWYMFNKPPLKENVVGGQISSAQSTTDENGNPAVAISYKHGGGETFHNITRSLAQEANAAGITQGLPNAIVVDNQLVSTPTVDPVAYPDGISGNASQVTGLSKAEADLLALQIQSGTLPVTFTVLSENLVSATLGKTALHSGLIAGAIGLLVVMIFLLVVYGFLGLIADLALIIYGLLLAGIVALIPVTMTLPGIAGTILTIGVAADANIVIFERIKEEVRAGKTIRTAISTGYRRGFHTIIDANVITLITAGVLYATATSSVKGFALMLLIGVVTSIFTAVVATRAMLGLLGRFQFMANPRVLGSVGSGTRWDRIDFVGRRKIWFSISAIIVIAAVISLSMNGLNKGIDFTGGSQFTFKTTKALNTSDMGKLVYNITGSDTVIRGVTSTGQAQGNTFNEFQLQSHHLTSAEQQNVTQTLEQKAGAHDFSINSVSSSFGQSVLNSAYLAVIFSLIIIFIYVSFRFEWTFAVPVMIALAHDIVITVGLYSLSGRAVTADTVAAILTVLGYSMYDTVIVFDRVRENIPILRNFTATGLVNRSLSETVTRSINTTLVTMIPVVLLYLFGQGTLKDFAFALIIGLISGAYSSIFIAGPVLAWFLERRPEFVRRRQDREKHSPQPASASAPVIAADGGGAVVASPGTVSPPPRPTRRRRRGHGRNR